MLIGTRDELLQTDSGLAAIVDISIILPVGGPGEHGIAGVASDYAEALDALTDSFELVVVPYAGGQVPDELALIPNVRVCLPTVGWGASVAVGLRASSGRLLCYTNWRRTSASVLSDMVGLALRNQDVVLRANRRTRDTRIGRMGSLLYNLECRLLLQVPVWDVNGTPKIFPRSFAGLVNLKQTGDLFDAEFAAVCERAGYPVVEVPVDASLRTGVGDSVGAWAALRMYVGVIELRARMSK
jgi:hypothetical protein